MATKKEIALLDAYKAASIAYDLADANVAKKAAARDRRAQVALDAAYDEYNDAERIQSDTLTELLDGIER